MGNKRERIGTCICLTRHFIHWSKDMSFAEHSLF